MGMWSTGWQRTATAASVSILAGGLAAASASATPRDLHALLASPDTGTTQWARFSCDDTYSSARQIADTCAQSSGWVKRRRGKAELYGISTSNDNEYVVFRRGTAMAAIPLIEYGITESTKASRSVRAGVRVPRPRLAFAQVGFTNFDSGTSDSYTCRTFGNQTTCSQDSWYSATAVILVKDLAPAVRYSPAGEAKPSGGYWNPVFDEWTAVGKPGEPCEGVTQAFQVRQAKWRAETSLLGTRGACG